MIRYIRSVTAILGLMVGCGGAYAQRTCDNGLLRGPYAFTVVGSSVGIFDSSGTLHPFASPLPINVVGQAIFDGQGGYTRVDFAVQEGSPVSSPPLTSNGFRADQVGTYDIAEDCTGTMTNSIPSGQTNTFAIVLVRYGEQIFGVVTGTNVPSVPPAALPSGTSCDAGCSTGVNLSINFIRDSGR
jgi:hypothetical protein